MILSRAGRAYTKPPPGARLNYSHPLAKGIVCATLLNEGSGYPYDLGKDRQVGADSEPRWGASIAGRVVRMPAIGNFLSLGVEGTNLVVPVQQATVALIRRKTDLTLRGSSGFGVNDRRLTATMPWSDGNVYFDFGGQSGPNRLTWTGYSVSTNLETWVFVAGSRGSAIYFNGILRLSQSTGITRGTPGGDQFNINGAAGTGFPGDIQEFSMFLLLDAQWTAEMVRQFHAAPYQLFLAQSPSATYFLPAAGGGTTITGLGKKHQGFIYARPYL